MHAKVKHRVADGVRWSVLKPDGTEQLLAETGRKAQVTAPNRAGAVEVVTAYVDLRHGRTLQEAAIVRTLQESVLVRAKSVDNQGSASVSSQTYAADNEDRRAFCQVASKARDGDFELNLPSGIRLRVRDARVSDDNEPPSEVEDVNKDKCPEAGSIEFDRATLDHPNGGGVDKPSFDQVEGRITLAGGLKLEQMRWTLPKAIGKNLPASFPIAILAESGKQETKSALQNGEWQPLTGSMFLAGKGIPLMPLPGGWKVGDNKLSFLPDAGVRLDQDLEGPVAGIGHVGIVNNGSGWREVEFSAANVFLATAPGGGTLMAAGSGRLSLDGGNSVSLGVSCYVGDAVVATCELAKGLYLKDVGVKWGLGKIEIGGNAEIEYGPDRVRATLALDGRYSGPSDWQIGVSAGKLDIGLGKLGVLGAVGGEIVMEKVNDAPRLSINLSVGLNGIQLDSSLTLKKISAEFVNTCPIGAESCDRKTLKLQVYIDLEAKLPGLKRMDLRATGQVELRTLAYRVDLGGAGLDTSVGPETLAVDRAQFFLSNAVPACRPAETGQPQEQNMSLGFIGKTKVLQSEATAYGQFDDAGYCIYANQKDIRLGDEVKMVDGIAGYSSYPGGAILSDPVTRAPVGTLPPGKVVMRGVAQIPEKVAYAVGAPTRTNFEASFTRFNDLTFSLSYKPEGEINIYRKGETKISLSEVGLFFNINWVFGRRSSTFGAFAKGSVVLPAGPDSPASKTPLGVSLAFEAKAATPEPDKDKKPTPPAPVLPAIFTLRMQAGIETEGGALGDAFGQKGLVVRQLSVSLGVDLPAVTPEVGFNADVTLPESWVSAIGVKPGVRTQLAFKLSSTQPCIQIAIGEQDPKKRQIAVDLANLGLIKARYFALVISPQGCRIPVGGNSHRDLQPGYGLTFDGEILDNPLLVTANFLMPFGSQTLADKTQKFFLDAKLKMPELDLYAARLGGSKPGTPLDLDILIDTRNAIIGPVVDIKLDAGVEIGCVKCEVGSFVAVKGAIKYSRFGGFDVDIAGKGEAVLGGLRVEVRRLDIKGKLWPLAELADKNYFSANADVSAGVAGVEVTAQGGVEFRRSRLESLMISAGLTVDLGLAGVSGTGTFNYCMGTLSSYEQGGSTCSPYNQVAGNASPALRVGAYGYAKALWWKKYFATTFYDRPGQQGTEEPKPADLDNLVVLPPQIPSVDPNLMNLASLKAQHDIGGGEFGFFKTVGAKKLPAAPGCAGRISAKWAPTTTTPNPALRVLDPSVGSTSSCGLLVDMPTELSYAYGKVRHTVVCGPADCRDEKSDRIYGMPGSGSMAELRLRARDRLIAGVASPPGVLPAGARLNPGDPLISPDGEWSLDLPKGERRLVLKKGGEVKWRSQEVDFSSIVVGRDGRLLLIRGDGKDDQVMVGWLGFDRLRLVGDEDRYVFVQDGLQGLRRLSGEEPQRLWGINSAGRCLQGNSITPLSCLVVASSPWKNWQEFLPPQDRPGATGQDPNLPR